MSDETRLLLAALVFVLVGLGVLLRRRRRSRAAGPVAATALHPDDPAVAERFQRRRMGCLLAGVLVGPPAILPMFYDPERFLVPGFVAFVVLFVALPFFAIRCPACGEIPEADEEGITLNPAKCSGCGARLE